MYCMEVNELSFTFKTIKCEGIMAQFNNWDQHVFVYPHL